jgi:hypothetical protein
MEIVLFKLFLHVGVRVFLEGEFIRTPRTHPKSGNVLVYDHMCERCGLHGLGNCRMTCDELCREHHLYSSWGLNLHPGGLRSVELQASGFIL